MALKILLLRRSRSVRLGGAILFFAAIALLARWCFLSQSESNPLAIGLTTITNSPGLVFFNVSNRADMPLEYWVLVETRTNLGWSRPMMGSILHWEDRSHIEPKQNLIVATPPPLERRNWRIVIRFIKSPTHERSVITKLRNFLEGWGLQRIADKLPPGNPGRMIFGPEIEMNSKP